MTEPMPERPMSAVERLARAMGRDAPPPMTEEEHRAFMLAQEKADEDAAAFYRAQSEGAA